MLPGAGRLRGVVSFAKLRIEAPVNGGRNYNGPKVAKFLSDPHERRNDLGTVSTRDSVKS